MEQHNDTNRQHLEFYVGKQKWSLCLDPYVTAIVQVVVLTLCHTQHLIFHVAIL